MAHSLFSSVGGSVLTLLPRQSHPHSVSARSRVNLPRQSRGKRAAPGLHWRGPERQPMTLSLLWTLLQPQMQLQAWREPPEAPECVRGWGPLSLSLLERSSGQLVQSGLCLGFLSSQEKRKHMFLQMRKPHYCFLHPHHRPGPPHSPQTQQLEAVDSQELIPWLLLGVHLNWEPWHMERRPTKGDDRPRKGGRSQRQGVVIIKGIATKTLHHLQN